VKPIGQTAQEVRNAIDGIVHLMTLGQYFKAMEQAKRLQALSYTLYNITSKAVREQEE